jgi:hypothetical protein
MFIIKKKIKKVKDGRRYRTYYSIVETVYRNKKPQHRLIRYLGTAEKINEIFEKAERKKRKKK